MSVAFRKARWTFEPGASMSSAVSLRRPMRAGAWMAASLVAAACTINPPAGEPIGAGRSAIETARAAGADDASIPEMTLARDKLARAEAASRANDPVRAQRLAEEATVDAQVARARIAADKSRKAAAEVDATLAALREEMTRDSTVITIPVKP